eukprot:1652274-Pyramimonas_sp.AAC.2
MKFPKPLFDEPVWIGPEWLTSLSPIAQALIGLGMGVLLAILMGRAFLTTPQVLWTEWFSPQLFCVIICGERLAPSSVVR